MKNRIENLIKKLEEAKKNLSEKKNLTVSNIEKMADDIKKGFDKRLESLTETQKTLREAISQKIQLKKWKTSVIDTIFNAKIRHLLSMPFIYMMIFPGLLFHLFLEIYHQICFRLYKIPVVKMKDYFVVDRHLLGYLNWIEKANCIYCGYFNGLMAYAKEIAGRTEKYWCPIKHARRVKEPHSQYADFVDYLDAETFRKEKNKLRDFSNLENKDIEK